MSMHLIVDIFVIKYTHLLYKFIIRLIISISINYVIIMY